MRDGADVGGIAALTSVCNNGQTRYSSQVNALNKEITALNLLHRNNEELRINTYMLIRY